MEPKTAIWIAIAFTVGFISGILVANHENNRVIANAERALSYKLALCDKHSDEYWRAYLQRNPRTGHVGHEQRP